MPTSATVARLARVGAGLTIAGCVAGWMWIREAPPATIWVAAIAAALAALLHAIPRRGLAVAADLALFALSAHALYRFYRPDDWRRGVPAGEQHWDRLPSGVAAHALLAASVLFVGIYLVVRFAPPAAWAVERLRLRLSPRVLVINAGLLLAIYCAVDLFCIDRGAPFSTSRARFHPFLAYDLPDSYLYHHASERIVKDMRGIPFAQQKPPGTIRVILAGASTVWGHELPVEQSLSRALQRALDRKFPNDHYEVLVVAFPGKYQLNELIDATVTLPHWSPDLVISLNGWNEAQYGEQPDHYEGMPYVAPQLAATLESHPVTAWGYQNTFFGSVLWKHQLERVAAAPRTYAVDPAPYEPPRYYAYLRSTARTLKQANIPYAYAFCPSVHELPAHKPEGWGGPRDPDVWTRERRKAAREIVADEHQLSYDVMQPFLSARPEDVFMDDCHFVPHGIDLLAADLAEQIPRWIAQGKPAPATP